MSIQQVESLLYAFVKHYFVKRCCVLNMLIIICTLIKWPSFLRHTALRMFMTSTPTRGEKRKEKSNQRKNKSIFPPSWVRSISQLHIGPDWNDDDVDDPTRRQMRLAFIYLKLFIIESIQIKFRLKYLQIRLNIWIETYFDLNSKISI